MILLSHEGDVDGNHHRDHVPSHCMEQGQAHRPEIAAEAERDLGDQDPAAARMSNARTGVVQLATDSKLRGCDLVSLRVHDVTHGTRVASRDGYAEEDATAGSVRANRTNA